MSATEDREGKQAPGPKPKPRPATAPKKIDDPVMGDEIKSKLASGKPLQTAQMARRYGTSKNTVDRRVDVERALLAASHNPLEDEPSIELGWSGPEADSRGSGLAA